MKIKIIATGSSKWERFIRRWGVSFLIGEDVLFDTFGDPRVFLKNMRKLSVDTAKIKHIVLSHDDWDHIAGLWDILSNRKDITVYVCPGFNQEIKDRIASFGVKMVEAKEKLLIKDGIYSTGELCGESKGRKIVEQSVVIRTGARLGVICGCSHPGVVNIVRQVKENFHENVFSLMGGFHLKDNASELNRNIINNLRGLGIRKIVPMHCTGKRATEMIRGAFGQDFVFVKEGDNIEL